MSYLVRLSLNTPALAQRFAQVLMASGGFEIQPDSEERGPVDLWIVELGIDPAGDLEEVQARLAAGEAGEVFLTSGSIEPSVLMQAMRIGVKEFLPQPLDAGEIEKALGRFRKRKTEEGAARSRKRGRVLTVFGSKGGVGTTTVAVNLAVSLTQGARKHSVALLDMNTLFGEIPLFLEMAPKFNWSEITKNIDRLDGTFLQNILSRHKSGLQVLPSPAYLNGHVRPTPEIMKRLIGLMRTIFDFVVVDAGQSTEETSLKVMELSDTLLLVTILSLPCLANTNKLLRSLTELGYVGPERIKVVLNRYLKKGEIAIGDAEAGIGQEFYWVIPNDFATTMSAINGGKPLFYLAPKSPITKSFLDLAASLTAAAPEEKAKKKWGIL
jgi:pilus assembly protein CpaE